MKKIICVLLSIVLCMGLSACGQEQSVSSGTKDTITDCESLGHDEGEWEKTDVDYVNAEQHYEKKCKRCNKVTDMKTEPLTTLRNGNNFIITPKGFINRINGVLNRFPDGNITAQAGKATGDYACVFTVQDKIIGYLDFIGKDSDTGKSKYQGADDVFGCLMGQCYNEELMGHYVMSVVMTLHPDLSDEAAAKLTEDIAAKIDTKIPVVYDNVSYSGFFGDNILVFTAAIIQK